MIAPATFALVAILTFPDAPGTGSLEFVEDYALGQAECAALVKHQPPIIHLKGVPMSPKPGVLLRWRCIPEPRP